MRLFELAYCVRIYEQTTGFDTALREFREVTAPRLDLNRLHHTHALLRWLNAWGCRQFSLSHHDLAAREVMDWWTRWESGLPA